MKRLFDNPELERRIQERLFTRLSSGAQRQLRRTLTGAVMDAAKEYERGSDIGMEIVISQRTEALTKTLEGLWTSAYRGVGGRVLRHVKSVKFERKDFLTEEFERGIERYIATYGAEKIVTLVQTTKNQVRGYVRQGLEDGLSHRAVAELIRDNGRRDSLIRALVIARTESHSAAMAGSLEAANIAGVPGMKKEWVSAQDERTREIPKDEFDHVAANGQIVDMDGMFDITGESLSFPGDPAGSAGNVINCRCALGYVMGE